jgi:hypothetical protein
LTLNVELAELLNRHSRENNSNTPDFILANYLMKCLEAFEVAVNKRSVWYDHHDSPGGVDTSYTTIFLEEKLKEQDEK